jgi:phage shock protein C
MDDIRQSFGRQGLVRPRDGRILGGVFAGLGRRFGLEPWPARIVFTLLMLIVPGSQILLYPLLWVLMPSEDAPATVPTVSGPPAAA